MKYFFWDIESAPQEGFFWQAKTSYIPHSMQEEDTTILSAAWRDDKGVIRAVKIDPRDVRNDEKVVRRIHKELTKCGEENIIIVHQNGDRFDIPKMKARFIYYRLPPLPQLVTIDTLTKARSVGFDYKRLDYLDKYLHGEEAGKVETRGWLMWRDIVSKHSTLSQRRKALNEMVEYNKGDIVALERVFYTMKPYMDKLPNANLWQGTKDCCPACGSDNVIFSTKPQITLTRVYRRKSCKDCGKWFRETKSMKEYTALVRAA